MEKEKPNFDIATINPPLVLGPVVHYLNSLEAINTSNQRILDMIRGKYKEHFPSPDVFFWVDVRDVALAHVKAIEVSEAGGKRFFILEGFFSNKKIADIIREAHPELESKLPPKDAKDDILEGTVGFNNSRSKEILGIKYRSLKESVSDTANSLLELGAGRG